MVRTETLWNDLSGRLLGYLKKRTRQEEDAKDLLQDIFIKIHLHQNQLKDENKLHGWVSAITRNVLSDYYKELSIGEEINVVQNDSETELDTVIEKCLLPFINELPEKYKQAIWWSEIKGMSQKELAKKLGISYSGAKSRVQRGRELLRQSFIDCCDFQLNSKGQYVDKHEGPGSCPKCD